jgi:signal transduction histidine kinase
VVIGAREPSSIMALAAAAPAMGNDIERMMQHDLKTPLNVIMGYSELISEHSTSIDEKEIYSKYIYEAGKKILYMHSSCLPQWN